MIKRIISGGQTGADRAALDFAIKMDLPHGGWVPKGRLTEGCPLTKGVIYPRLTVRATPKRTNQDLGGHRTSFWLSNINHIYITTVKSERVH